MKKSLHQKNQLFRYKIKPKYQDGIMIVIRIIPDGTQRTCCGCSGDYSKKGVDNPRYQDQQSEKNNPARGRVIKIF